MLGIALAAIFGIPISFVHPDSQVDEADWDKGTGRGAASGLFLHPVPPTLSILRPYSQRCFIIKYYLGDMGGIFMTRVFQVSLAVTGMLCMHLGLLYSSAMGLRLVRGQLGTIHLNNSWFSVCLPKLFIFSRGTYLWHNWRPYYPLTTPHLCLQPPLLLRGVQDPCQSDLHCEMTHCWLRR